MVAILRLFGVFLIAATAIPALGDDTLDATFRTGAAFGTITYTNDSNDVISGSFGGVPLGFLWNRGLSKSASLLAGGGVLLDLKNTQLIKQGVAGGIAWHFLGGPRRYMKQGASASFVTRNPQSLSLVTYGGLQNFAATDAKNTKAKVSGSVFEVDFGLEYRHDFSDTNSATFEIINSVFTLPASVSRIRPTSTEIMFGWRTFI